MASGNEFVEDKESEKARVANEMNEAKLLTNRLRQRYKMGETQLAALIKQTEKRRDDLRDRWLALGGYN